MATTTPTDFDPTDPPTLAHGCLVCPRCEMAHRPRGGHGQLEELGECDSVALGWECPCGQLLSDAAVLDCLDRLAADKALSAAGVW